MILIYTDQGTSTDSIRELQYFFTHDAKIPSSNVKCVMASDLQKSDWLQKTKLLIFPGGRSLPFYEKLGKQGNQRIIEFVMQGGHYVGLCAGAYYACAKTIFAKGLEHELILPGELNFFEGNAIGPVFSAEKFKYNSEQGARIVNIDFDHQTFSVYFNGGCYFKNADQKNNVTILATYSDLQKPAIIQCQVGQGSVILSGVHPELSYRTIPNDHDSHHQYLRKMLTLNDEKRVALVNQLLITSLFLVTKGKYIQ